MSPGRRAAPDAPGAGRPPPAADEHRLLALDAGNGYLSAGIFAGRRLLFRGKLGLGTADTGEGMAVRIAGLLDFHDHAYRSLDDVVLGCSDPGQTAALREACRLLVGRPPFEPAPGTPSGMSLRVEWPREVSADRVANALAARTLFGGGPAIAVEFETAVCLDCVDAEGAYVGSVLFPGVATVFDALARRGSQVGRIELRPPERVIGRSTAECVRSGAAYGFAGLVDHLIARIRRELGAGARVVATGDDARWIAPLAGEIERVEPSLTLEGLRLLYEYGADRHRSVSRTRRPRAERLARREDLGWRS